MQILAVGLLARPHIARARKQVHNIRIVSARTQDMQRRRGEMRDARLQLREPFTIKRVGFGVDDDVIGAQPFEHVHCGKCVVGGDHRAVKRFKQIGHNCAHGRRAANSQDRAH